MFPTNTSDSHWFTCASYSWDWMDPRIFGDPRAIDCCFCPLSFRASFEGLWQSLSFARACLIESLVSSGVDRNQVETWRVRVKFGHFLTFQCAKIPRRTTVSWSLTAGTCWRTVCDVTARVALESAGEVQIDVTCFSTPL